MTAVRERPPAPREGLLAFLGDLERLGFAVAKADDLWGNLARGGDWDLFVVDLPASVAALTRHVGPPTRVLARAHVTACFYEWGEIDFLSAVDYRGIPMVTAREAVADVRLSDAGVCVARPAHVVVASVFHPVLAYGTYKRRYKADMDLALAEDTQALHQITHRLFRMPADVACATTEAPRALRRAFLRSALSTPRASGRGILRHVVVEVASLARPSGPRWVLGDAEVLRTTRQHLEELKPLVPGVSEGPATFHPLSRVRARRRRRRGEVVLVLDRGHAGRTSAESVIAATLRRWETAAEARSDVRLGQTASDDRAKP